MKPQRFARWTLAGIGLACAVAVVVWASSQYDDSLVVERALKGLIPLGLIVWVFVGTRRKPGERRDERKHPPGQADADLDNWTGWG